MTEKQSVDGLYTLTQPVIVTHPQFFEAKAFMRKGKPAGDPKFSGSFVFEPDSPDLAALKALAVKLAKTKWPDRDVIQMSKEGKFKFPFTSGDKIAAAYAAKQKEAGKEDDGRADFQKGKVVIKTASKYAPRLSVVVNGKAVDLTPENTAQFKSQFYFGVKALGQLNLVAYDKVGETGVDGITVYLNMVLSLNKGERLTGGAPGAEVFKDYLGTMTAEDPTAGGVDEIVF